MNTQMSPLGQLVGNKERNNWPLASIRNIKNVENTKFWISFYSFAIHIHAKIIKFKWIQYEVHKNCKKHVAT